MLRGCFYYGKVEFTLSINRSQIQRLKTGNVNVNTLNNILNVLEDCTLDDICEFTPDKTGKEDEE